MRRAVAIQKIIRNEFGMAWNENPLSGSFVVAQLTDLVEEAVLAEFDRLNARGGVLAAMERQYQRNRIQEESLLYETRKDSGEIPIIGVNTFLAEPDSGSPEPVPLAPLHPGGERGPGGAGGGRFGDATGRRRRKRSGGSRKWRVPAAMSSLN